jgi:signal transduction histidine kinase/CheY-like chemotaxis protein
MTGVDQGKPAPAPFDWRHKLLDWLLIYGLGLATVAFPVIVVQAVTFTHPGWVLVMALLYLTLVAAALFRSLPYVVRALGLLTGLGAVAVLGFMRVGYQVGPGLGSALLVVLSGLLLGRRAMISAFALTLCAILITGLYTVSSKGFYVSPGSNDPSVLSNWVRVAVVYALFTGVLSAAVSFVVGHVERLLAQRTDALEGLRAASLLKQEAEHRLDGAQRTILQMQKLEALGRLAGGVAHDFNNALVVILGYADLLRSRLNDPLEVKRGLDEIIHAGNHAAGLTRQLLSFGRRAVSIPVALHPQRLFTEVEGLLRRVLPENIRLSLCAGDDVPAIFADPGEMQQVLLNLCMNARDAMPEGGVLEVNAARIEGASRDLPPGEWVAITVRDTGAGMDDQTRARAFEPFFTTKGERGTGLGLSTVYGIVGNTGGHVLVESRPGQGSTFTLLLPPSAAEETRLESGRVPKAAGRPSTILVAEDEPAVRGLIVSALRSAGHHVLAAEDGNTALEIARRYRGDIDLLCTDGVMPGTSSTTLIASFRALFPSANVLVCSGHSEELTLDPSRLLELRYLQKPFTVETLLESVSAALEKPAKATQRATA